jgi:hypothetical protein
MFTKTKENTSTEVVVGCIAMSCKQMHGQGYIMSTSSSYFWSNSKTNSHTANKWKHFVETSFCITKFLVDHVCDANVCCTVAWKALHYLQVLLFLHVENS